MIPINYHVFLLKDKNECKSQNWDIYLLMFTLFSVLFIPIIKINNSLFLGIEEFLIVIMGIRLLTCRFYFFDRFIFYLVLIALIVLISILVNPNIKDYREYLEIYKLFRIGIIYLFGLFVMKDHFSPVKITKWITYSFIFLAIFNVLHILNIFYFNEYVTILYDSDGRDVINFGKNSLGGPGPKRIVGTMGNPNINAILFLLYFSFYAFLLIQSKFQNSTWNIYSYKVTRILFLVSMLFVILCQSRTGIGILLVVYLLTLIYRKSSLKEFFYDTFFVFAFFGLSAYLDTIALQYLYNTKPQLQENNSLSMRFEIWKNLIKMWTKQPFFGYGPNKNYVYSEKLYPENEYVFYLWKYGLQGLFAYIILVFSPIVFFFKKNNSIILLLFITLIISIEALTNNPLADPKISFLYPLFLGLSIFIIYKTDNQNNPYVK